MAIAHHISHTAAFLTLPWSILLTFSRVSPVEQSVPLTNLDSAAESSWSWRQIVIGISEPSATLSLADSVGAPPFRPRRTPSIVLMRPWRTLLEARQGEARQGKANVATKGMWTSRAIIHLYANLSTILSSICPRVEYHSLDSLPTSGTRYEALAMVRHCVGGDTSKLSCS